MNAHSNYQKFEGDFLQMYFTASKNGARPFSVLSLPLQVPPSNFSEV